MAWPGSRAGTATTGDHPFSVAEHALVVEELLVRLAPRATATDRLMALLHDAPEYVIGDMISPFKAAIGLDYKAFEARLMAAVHIRFGLAPVAPAALAAQIKRADRLSAWFEATQLAGFAPDEAAKFFPVPRFAGADQIRLDPRPTTAVKLAFLGRFTALYAQVCR